MEIQVKQSPTDARDFTTQEINRQIKPTIMNQMDSSMCGAFAVCYLKEIQEYRERGMRTIFSPSFLYGLRDGQKIQEGVFIRAILKDLKKFGVCEFKDFPLISDVNTIYNELRKNIINLTAKALQNRIEYYYKIEKAEVEEIKKAIYANGGVIIGFDVYKSFYRILDFVIEPNKQTETYEGYHIMCAYDVQKINGVDCLVVANSWGVGWGDEGVCYIPLNHSCIKEIYSFQDSTTKVVDDIKIIFKIDDFEMRTITNDTNVLYEKFDVAPLLKNGRTMIELNAFTNAIGGQLKWDNKNKTITMTFKKFVDFNIKDGIK
jgi:hypothetical protein